MTASAAVSAQLLRGLKMVVVDDNRPFRELLRNTLIIAGAVEVQGFADADSALAAIRIEPPHLVITDWRMAPRDGGEFLRALRGLTRSDQREPVPVIVLSAYASTSVIEVAMGLGARTVLVKPFAPQRLIERIAKVLNLEDGGPAEAGLAAGVAPSGEGARDDWQIE